jgi:small subunit ribosomal protein S4
MGRYTGPRRRIVRRLGDLPGLTRKTRETRPYPPGQHQPSQRRRRTSEFGIRLQEKQKVRFHYGLRESQLRNAAQRASRQRGKAGTNLLTRLERRLDNVVFRLGLAPTIPAARQLVRHGHVRVDGHRVSVPAHEVRVGSQVTVSEHARTHPLVQSGVKKGPELVLPGYLERRPDGLGGRVVAAPTRDDIGLAVNETYVIEFYAR